MPMTAQELKAHIEERLRNAAERYASDGSGLNKRNRKYDRQARQIDSAWQSPLSFSDEELKSLNRYFAQDAALQAQVEQSGALSWKKLPALIRAYHKIMYHTG